MKNADFDMQIDFSVEYDTDTKDYSLAIAADYDSSIITTLKSDHSGAGVARIIKTKAADDSGDKSYITVLDPKTRLQEYSLKMFKKLPIYRLLSSKGPKHNPTFKVSVIIEGSAQFIGLGNSKKLAQQDGAYNLLKSTLENLPCFAKYKSYTATNNIPVALRNKKLV